MDVPVRSEDAGQFTEEHLSQIRDILKNSFSGRGIDDEISSINLIPVDSKPSVTFGSSDCQACDVGYGVAVAACNLVPPPFNVGCFAAATLAYNKCREINCG